MKDNLSYEEALADLKKILDDLQNEQLSIDDQANQSKQATTLIEYCRAKLKGIEDDLSVD